MEEVLVQAEVARNRRRSAETLMTELRLHARNPEDLPCSVSPLEALRMLGKVPWFRGMSNTVLRRLLERCRVERRV